MAAGMVNIGKRGGVASCSYILRNKECEAFVSNMGMEKIEVLHLVKTYIDIEQSGSKELSIRANANPKLMTKLILSLPNENSTEENLEYLKNVLEEIGIIDYPYVLAIHRGEKDGILNKHAHINFFERKFEKGNSNKNRLFNAKDFVSQVLVKYQKVFGLTANEEIRERIPRIEFQEHAEALKEMDIVNKEIISLDKEITYERRLAIAEILKEDDKIEAAAETEKLELLPVEITKLPLVEMLETEAIPVIQVGEPVEAAEEIQPIESIELAKIEIPETEAIPVIQVDELVEAAEEIQPIENIELAQIEIPETEAIPVIQVGEPVEAVEEIQSVKNVEHAPVEILENEAMPLIQVDEPVAAEKVQLIKNIELDTVEIVETKSVQEIQTQNDGRFRRSTFSDTETDKTEPETNYKPNRGNSEPLDTQSLQRDTVEPRIDYYEPSGNDEGDAVDETDQQADVGIDKQHGQVSASDFKRTEPDIETEPANSTVQDITEPEIDNIDLKGDDGRTVKNAKINRPRTKIPEIVPDRDDDDDEPKKRKKGLRL